MMSASVSTFFTRNRQRTAGVFCSAALLAAIAGCSNSGPIPRALGTPGAALNDPQTGLEFFVDPSEGGLNQELILQGVFYGRLVRVFGLLDNTPTGAPDLDGPRLEVRRDFLIGPNNLGTTAAWTIQVNPISGEESLIVFQNINPDLTANPDFETNKEAFDEILGNLASSATPVSDPGLGTTGMFTAIPRNATVMLRFNDLLDASTLTPQNLRVLFGTQSLAEFDARIVVDPNYGDLVDDDGDGEVEFHSTRVLIDSTVSQMEQLASPTVLAVNNAGLPPSENDNLGNVQIRIPTAAGIGQTSLLQNLSEHEVSRINSGSVDFNSPTLDVTRVVRSASPSGDLNNDGKDDNNNGYLPDNTNPQVIASLGGSIFGNVIENINGDPNLFMVESLNFNSVFCAQQPAPGDFLQQFGPDILAEVEFEGTPPDTNGTVNNLIVRLISFPDSFASPSDWLATAVGPVQFLSAYDPDVDITNRVCFLQVFGSLTTGPIPGVNITNDANLGLRFSEALDGTSVSPFDSLRLSRTETPNDDPFGMVIGSVLQTDDLRSFQFDPSLPLAHQEGSSEQYFLTLEADNSDAVTDLAGNRLLESPASVDVGPLMATINPDSPTASNSGRMSRFTRVDDEAPFGDDEQGPFAEWAGQVLFNTTEGTMQPRPVTRFTGLADDTSLTIPIQFPSLTAGVIEPLSRLGAKVQMMWRYPDVGFELLDTQSGKLNQETLNLDIEGVSWAPSGGQPAVDNFSLFEMRMSHGFFLPDEPVTPPAPIVPVFPTSGLVGTFDDNLLSLSEDPQRVVHSRELGYFVNPGDIIVTGGGTRLLPFPLNQGNPSNFEYYTWRDTSVNTRAAPNGFGAPLLIDTLVTMGGVLPVFPDGDGNCPPVNQFPTAEFFPPDEVKTAALPLLIEFRCFPDSTANSQNRFDTNLVITASTAPFFRAYSAGGINTAQNDVLINPDLQGMATGGFNPMSIPVAGTPLPGLDNNFYIGSLDFVVRVSHAFSVWRSIEPVPNTLFPNAVFFPPIIEPAPEDQPQGTSLAVAFRGANVLPAVGGSDATNPGFAIQSIATELDPYGDFYNDRNTVDDCFNLGGNPTGADPNIFFVRNHSSINANPGIIFPLVEQDAWLDDVAQINGANFYQVRITFFSNPATNQTPDISSFGLTWTNE